MVKVVAVILNPSSGEEPPISMDSLGELYHLSGSNMGKTNKDYILPFLTFCFTQNCVWNFRKET